VVSPGTQLITDDGLIGLIQNCSLMKNLKVSGTSGGGRRIEGNAHNELRAHPEWVPGLKSLKLVDNEKSKVFMTAMREMSRASLGNLAQIDFCTSFNHLYGLRVLWKVRALRALRALWALWVLWIVRALWILRTFRALQILWALRDDELSPTYIRNTTMYGFASAV
jgi:hypothetical protein